MKNSLLINEAPLQVLPTLAAKIGLNEAIVLQQLHYWLVNPKNAGKVVDGKKWIFNTYEEWQENFPFWSTRTIARIFASLEQQGIVISDQFNKGAYDRTKFYTIDYDMLGIIDDDKNVAIDDDNLSYSLIESETTTETITEKIPASKNEKTKDLVDGWAELAQMPGAKKAVRIDSLQSIIKTRLSIEPTRRAWIDFLTFADKRQQEHGESLTVFLDWLTSQPRFDVSYWPPAKMQENWARAFAVEKSSASNGVEILW